MGYDTNQTALQVLIIVRCLIFNYACCQALVNNNLFTLRSSCIDRKKICLFAQAYDVTYFVVHDVMKGSSNLLLYLLDISIIAPAVLAYHSPRTCI